MVRGLVLLALIVHAPARVAGAQTITAGVDLLFYGDNTEFANPFRSGETRLGTAARLFADIELNDVATVRAGLFANGRYGAHQFVEEGEPVIALQLRRGPSTFIFGSLETMTWSAEARRPDLETPHQMLPPIQVETLTVTRAHEMGLQWLVAAPRLTHDAWINWQRLNTAAHRERFDAGYRARVVLAAPLALHGQWHVVHEGGQQFGSGPVSDSQAFGLGLEWSRRAPGRGWSVEAHAVATRHARDRERPASTEAGLGVFTRAAIERHGWHAHAIAWRSRDTLKEEGDPNYLVLRRDGTQFHNVRDYAEIGLTRTFTPAPGLNVAASARVHRIESHYEYSYRIVGRVRLRHRF